MMSGTEQVVSVEQHIFQFTCLFSASDIRLSARSEVGHRQLLAVITGSGDLTLHYYSGESRLPVMKRVPWFADATKRITALCFDPSGSWLLAAGSDGSIFIIPALSLVDPNAVLDHRWSTTDVTSFPSPLLHFDSASSSSIFTSHNSHPTSLVWWQSLFECHHVAIMGTERGDIIFVSLITGLQVGITFIRATISMLHIYMDNNLDSVFLLITSDKRSQWKLLLEQRETGYAWPIDSSGSAVRVVTSNSELISSSHNSLDLEFGNRSTSHLPTARSRLQGLKQLSFEKLINLRQRLAETRSKSAAAMAVNMHFRRESSGSSSDDTTGSSSLTSKSAAPENSDMAAAHHVTTGPQPERLSSQVGDTFLCPQYARGRYLLSGYYAPTSILTIHGTSLEVVPLFVHKLAPDCKDIVVTDKFLYITDLEGKNLSIVSCQLSESRLDGEADFNPDSVIQAFKMTGSNERIIYIYKQSESNYRHKYVPFGIFNKPIPSSTGKDSVQQISFDSKSRGGSKEREKKSATFNLPKNVKELKVPVPSIDTCVIVTTAGVYEVSLRFSPAEVFMDLVLTSHALEKAEKLALIFGLHLQQLLEAAGDYKLGIRDFPQAITLYKLSKCRHLKSVLKFAAGGHAAELLGYINSLFSNSGPDLATSERIHLSNLAVMSHTEQVLRSTVGKIKRFKLFLKFLRENFYYDEVLAVNVAGQTGLWEVLQFLASYRGLHQEVLDILTKILRSLGEGLMKAVESKTTNIKYLPALDSGLWLCVSDPSLLQSLLAKPQQARIHLQFVRTCLPHLEQFALQRLAALYDPSSPQLRPCLKRMFKISHKRENSGGPYSSRAMHMDSTEILDSVDEIFVSGEDIIQTFLLVLLYLARKRQVFSFSYLPELMEKIQLTRDDDEDSEDLCPSLPIRANSMSAGFSHVAVIRNRTVYTWGNAVQGCLGTGPTMSRYCISEEITVFPRLKLEVISVSCGRQHTLALTNNGVYAWGSSQFGQLGIGKTGQSPHPHLVEHLSRERIISVSAGQYHSIALADDGRVFTWGWGVHGQLGHNSIEDCHTPTLVERLIGKVIVQICGGHGHTLVLTAEGQVYTFGSSVFGQLGNGSIVKSSVPVHVSVLTERITVIATGYFHNLAVSSSNKLYVWGSSPQVLRLQAQAQKKARLFQHHQQQSSSSVTPSSPAGNTTTQVHSASDFSSETKFNLQENSSTFHNPTFTESLETELPDTLNKSQLASKDRSCSPSAILSRNQDLSTESARDILTSHSQLPSSLVNNSANTMNSSSIVSSESAKCHSPSLESRSYVPVVNFEENEKKSSQTDNRVCETKELHSDAQNVTEKHGLESKPAWIRNSSPVLKQDSSPQPMSPSVFSDFENANMDSSTSADTQLPVSARSLDLKVGPTFPLLTSATAEAYSLSAIIVSPTVEFKGLTARRSPSIDTSLDSADLKLSNQSVKPENYEDGQSHLIPQLVDTSLVVGPIIQISCGCHHSALLTRDGVLYMWGRNLDGQLGNGTRKEVLIPTPLSSPAPNTKVSSASPTLKSASFSGLVTGAEKLRFQQVCCGCEFTIVQENNSAGKLWVWGNNSQAQLGRFPVEDSKGLEGKLVMLKTTKRVIKLPHGSQNSSDVPREVPGCPNCSSSFKYNNLSGVTGFQVRPANTCTELCPPLCSIEEPCYGLRTLHYTFQHFHGFFDSTHLLNKCLELENYQGAAKLAALDRHYHLALAYQLKALALANMEHGLDTQNQSENQCTNINKDKNEKHSNYNGNVTCSFTNSSKTRTRTKACQDLVSKGQTRSTSTVNNTDISNENKDTNSNSLIIDNKDTLLVQSTNENSSSLKQSVINSNVEISSAHNKIENLNDTNSEISNSDAEHMSLHAAVKAEIVSEAAEFIVNEKNILDENHLIKIPQNSDHKCLERVAEREVVIEVENRNQKNSEIQSKYKSKTNQTSKDNSPVKEIPKVEFSDEVSAEVTDNLKPDLILSESDCKKELGMKVEKGMEELNKERNLAVNSINNTQISPIEEDIETSSSISTPESLTSANAPDSEMHAFAVQGGTEQMSEGHRYLTSPDTSTSPLVSEEQGLLSPEPFLSQESEQNSHNTEVNLVPINENGEFKDALRVSLFNKDKGAENQKEKDSEKKTDVTTSAIDERPESLTNIKEENILRNTAVVNDEVEVQNHSNSFTSVIECSTISSDNKQSVIIETDNITNELKSIKLNDFQNTSETKSNTRSDVLYKCNGTLKKSENLIESVMLKDSNKMFGDETLSDTVNESNKIENLKVDYKQHVAPKLLENKNLETSEGIGSSVQRPAAMVDLPVEKNGSISQTVDNNLQSSSLPSSHLDEKPIQLSTRGKNQNTSKQPCSDRTDLENYENELKVSSGKKKLGLLNNGASVKSIERIKNVIPGSSESAESVESIELSKENNVVSQNKVVENTPSSENNTQHKEKTDDRNTNESTTCRDLVAQAAVIVEYYVSVMEEDSHTMMSRLLQQGIEFWLSHSLPVDHLENLLLKHMSKFFYPLGLLLFCKDGSTGEEETQQQALSMLNHLSTRFCLQLCSSLLSHIDQRKAYPEYIELLAQVTSMQSAPGLNGCCITNQGLSQSPEQVMEAILEGLGASKGLGGSLGQTYINLQEEVSESCKDSSETSKLEQLLAFSCGHHYGMSVFQHSVLPELELGLLQLHHPLPNTARVLKGLFGSNSPNLHLACPRCVLSYLQSQTSPLL